MKPPAWKEVEEFCRKDGWRDIRETDHRFFQKVLPDGTVLETHSSFSSTKTMSPGRFSAILRHQLRVSEAQFWEVLRTGKPARRPAPLPPRPRGHPAYLVRILKDALHLTEGQIAALSPDEARKLVSNYWSRKRTS